MKVKTSELVDAALDWSVCEAQGIEYVERFCVDAAGHEHEATNPSTNWSQGGPIIERERIAVTCTPEEWCAYSNGGEHPIGLTRKRGFLWTGKQVGPTPLIAAMRCFVASKLGDEVDVPEEFKE